VSFSELLDVGKSLGLSASDIKDIGKTLKPSDLKDIGDLVGGASDDS
jgi:hypothetical protein